MAQSKIEIANKALLLIGATRINSFEDSKVEAVVINEFYELALQYMISQYAWSFAMKTQTLAELATPPGAEYEHAFELPLDMFWMQRTYPIANFKIMGTQLHTNEKTISVKYITRPDEAVVPPYFAQAFVMYLASLIAVPLTENVSKRDSYVADAAKHLKIAKSLNAQQQPQDGFQEFPLDSSRYSGGAEGWYL